MIEPHRRLSALPAEEREATPDEPVEVHEALLVVLEDGTRGLDSFDAVVEAGLQVVPLLEQSEVRRAVRKVEITDTPAPVLLKIGDQFEDLAQADGPVV